MLEIFSKLGLDYKLIIAQAVNFVLLLIILQRLAYKPVLKMLNDRTEKIDKSLKQAKQIKEELKKTEETKLAEIKKGKEEYQKIIKESQEIAERKSQEAIEKTRIKTQEIVENAKIEIKTEKEKSVKEAKKEITDISILIAKKIIGNNLNEKEQKEIANDILSKI
ncbi:MAG: F0F1 ATP synthase subunit B [Candidatus Andersenbacteria bacterium]|nr:F0F1 ATP synthase subunit B [Candidatus Andersenbacteria bacterium]